MAVTLYSSCVVVALVSGILSVTGTMKDCPPWFTWDNSTAQCVCSDVMENAIMCDQREQRSYLRLGYCASQHSTTNDIVVADCPYVFPDDLIVGLYIPLPDKSSDVHHFICGNLSRETGTPLCGRCTNGTGPSVYSFGSQCVSCSAVNIAYYLLLQYLPTTILFVAIIVFRFNITSAPMAHYVLYCDILALVLKSAAGLYANFHHTTYYKPYTIVLTLNDIWTLDFFYLVSPPLCVSEHMEEIYMPFMDTVATLYPFILLLLTYVGIELHAHDFRPVVSLWRPIQRIYVRLRRTWDPNASMIQAFATLFFLSYAKLIGLMYEALFISVVINERGEVVSKVLYIDPTVPIFSRKHWYIISLSGFILIFIILPFLLLLIVFPTRFFQKISKYLKPRWVVSIQTFVDPFHGCYKDGTNGTKDYRAVSGYLLAIVTVLPAVDITIRVLATGNQFLTCTTFIIIFNAFTVVMALLKPYKHTTANISGVTIPAIFSSALAVVILFRNPSNDYSTTTVARIACVFLLSLPHCVFYGYIAYRLGKLLKSYCCKTRKMEDSVDEQLPCRPANTIDYSQLSEISS